ncbi:hypothetical protein AAF712_011926 [Marasmius tenuissimus]|uniref:Carbohydrate esterase family 16 protein n=1 Tax=Marasmius tenuissimus TaxID=585030 RepID=A0ABR2ZIR9_9AGAR
MTTSKWASYLLSLLSLTIVVSGQSPDPDANYWVSFGDSYTQSGFDVSSTLPNRENPIGNPPYPGWTATGGEQWLDYDTTQFNKSLTLTYNFAYGGATIDANLVEPYEPTVKSMTDQINQFLDWNEAGGSAVWKSENTLFSVWIGINDIGNSFYLGGDRDAFSDTLLDAEFALVEKLMLTNPDGAAIETQVIAGFNSLLASRVASFESSHEGTKTFLSDTHAVFTKILDDPTAYGFRDNLTYGADPDLFWGNDYHPSSYAHKYFGQDVADVLKETVW